MPLCPRRDHARGNEELVRLCPGLRVYGADERIGALTHRVAPDEELTVCGALNGGRGAVLSPSRAQRSSLSPQFGAIRVRCLFTPCHTKGHMCYFMWEDGSLDAPALFSGISSLAPADPTGGNL